MCTNMGWPGLGCGSWGRQFLMQLLEGGGGGHGVMNVEETKGEDSGDKV